MTSDRWSTIERLYHEALARPVDDRAAFLTDACASDDSVRHEVESLLAHDGQAAFLSIPVAVGLAPAVSVSIGQRLGPYLISASLGAGGMGEVYRARDTTLGRDVAIKVLPLRFTSDSDRLARFEREARVLASLNHPHIGAIYGVENAEGLRALVLELVEGDTLADRLQRGPVPVAEALTIARQIADALDAAHEKGIIHRDLKPANIKITAIGVVKVLDFGLAKAASEDRSTPDFAQVPAVPVNGTLEGVILGTAAYMSPEQARGQAVDKRTDIWAFGCVLYELLTGRAAFLGTTLADTTASIIFRDPDWGVLPIGTPEGLRRLLRRCLDKDPRQRLRDIGEARIHIEQIVDDQDEPIHRQASPTGRLAPWLHSRWVVAGALAAGLVIALWAWPVDKPVDRPLVRLDVDLGADVSLPPTRMPGGLVISPDGTRLVYASGSSLKLFTRRLDQPKATELPGTDGAILPFFSSDGQWVGFWARGKLNKISVDGGAVVPLADVALFAGASWAEDGSILASVPSMKGLLQIPAAGGASETVAELRNGEGAFASPQILPGGKAVLFTTFPATLRDTPTIEILTLADHQRKVIGRGFSPRYLATSSGVGHLVYVNRATLFAIPFDMDKLETRGTAVPILDDVQYGITDAGFDVSRAGTLVHRRASGHAAALMTVQWVDPTGVKEPLQAKPGVYREIRLSPDGKRVALVVGATTESQDMWVYDTQRDAMTRLTSGQTVRSPTWSPDGHSVVFSVVGAGIFQTPADGASGQQALTVGPYLIPSSFTPDGTHLAYSDGRADRFQIWTVSLVDNRGHLEVGLPEQFLKSDYSDEGPSFSPDGRWLAYQSNESGKNEVYVRASFPPSPRQRGKWLISNNGGTAPRWSRSGHDLVYKSDDQLLAVSYTGTGETFVAGKPRGWIHQLGGTSWDLAPDGKRVAVLTPAEPAAAVKSEHEVVFLQNFFEELRRRVPVGK